MQGKPLVLMILDGFGLASPGPGNAVELADMTTVKKIEKTYPFVKGYASGEAVGLPDGQMGNSEVGHLNIGAGRIVYQELTRISKSIEEGDFFEKAAMIKLINNCKEKDSALHILGLLSDGGVHSLNKHLYACLDLAKRNGLNKVYVHAFMDGRDTAPKSGLEFIKELNEEIAKRGLGKIATVIGRYYSMDRDNRWDRVEKAYEAIAYARGIEAESALEAVEQSYAENITDEFILPTVIVEDGQPVGQVKDGDSLIFINFRPDRARQITRAFCDEDFTHFNRGERKDILFACMTDYDPTIKNKIVVFAKEKIENTLGQYLSNLGKKQLRLAETEKYPHVTFFFNGGLEEPYEGEDRILVSSPKVATYDLQPEMSAEDVSSNLVKAIEQEKYDLIIVNFANPDMVGHTGAIPAVVKALKEIDTCIKRAVEAVIKVDGTIFLCADHGNSECMISKDGQPMTAHTTNPVPFVLINYDKDYTLSEEGGKLCDIAPTLLEIMGLDKPEEMTGKSLLVKKK